MNQQSNPTSSSVARQQLQGILIELAEIERRLRSVNSAVVSIASDLAPEGQKDVDSLAVDEEMRVRAALVKPRSAVVVRTLAQANQRAEQLARLSPLELQVVMADSLQQAQADAVAQGIAIDDDQEAARGD